MMLKSLDEMNILGLRLGSMNGHFFLGNPEKLGDVPFFTTVTTIKHRSRCARGFVFTDPKGHQRQGLGPWGQSKERH